MIRLTTVPEGETSLQRATPEGYAHIRWVTAEERAEIIKAASFMRRYGENNPFRLLSTAHQTFEDAVEEIAGRSADSHFSHMVNKLTAELVSWLLLWRLTIDHWRHDISDRFGTESESYVKLLAALAGQYDARPAYRVVEGMRNLVQHREMPPLHVNDNDQLESDGTRSRTLSITISVEWFLNWPQCPRLLREYLEHQGIQRVDIVSAVRGAMDGLSEVLPTYVYIDTIDLDVHLRRLISLLDEAEPGLPLLATSRSSRNDNQLLEFNFVRFDDIIPILQPLRRHGMPKS